MSAQAVASWSTNRAIPRAAPTAGFGAFSAVGGSARSMSSGILGHWGATSVLRRDAVSWAYTLCSRSRSAATCFRVCARSTVPLVALPAACSAMAPSGVATTTVPGEQIDLVRLVGQCPRPAHAAQAGTFRAGVDMPDDDSVGPGVDDGDDLQHHAETPSGAPTQSGQRWGRRPRLRDRSHVSRQAVQTSVSI